MMKTLIDKLLRRKPKKYLYRDEATGRWTNEAAYRASGGKGVMRHEVKDKGA